MFIFPGILIFSAHMYFIIVFFCMQVLQSVLPIDNNEVVLGQYEGYKDDPTVSKDSNTPTFATMVLRIHNERWEGMLGPRATWSFENKKSLVADRFCFH